MREREGGRTEQGEVRETAAASKEINASKLGS